MKSTSRSSGRRPGKTVTRAKIAESAQQLFATKGYDRTTIRGIADRAEVDSALVLHFFKNKQKLFMHTMLPYYKAPDLLAKALEPDTKAPLGHALAQAFCALLEDEKTVMIITGIIRAASSEQEAAEMMNDFVAKNFTLPLSKMLPEDSNLLRVNMVGATFTGIILARYIIKSEPLASAKVKDLFPILKPILQSCFTEVAPKRKSSGQNPKLFT